jgi:hypothetical protein
MNVIRAGLSVRAAGNRRRSIVGGPSEMTNTECDVSASVALAVRPALVPEFV